MTLRQQVIDAVFACLTAAACEQYTHYVAPQISFGSNLVADIPNAMVNLQSEFRERKYA